MSTLSELDEEDRAIQGDSDDKQLAFNKLLKDYPIWLSKSQLPAVKESKDKAVAELIVKLQEQLMQIFTKATLAKKISRMKSK